MISCSQTELIFGLIIDPTLLPRVRGSGVRFAQPTGRNPVKEFEMTKSEKLQAALDAYKGDSGPITWSIESREDNGASLVATYSEDLVLEDEPWTQFGGDEILAAAGFDRCDGGMDNYQDKYGENLVCQWAIVHD